MEKYLDENSTLFQVSTQLQETKKSSYNNLDEYNLRFINMVNIGNGKEKKDKLKYKSFIYENIF